MVMIKTVRWVVLVKNSEAQTSHQHHNKFHLPSIATRVTLISGQARSSLCSSKHHLDFRTIREVGPAGVYFKLEAKIMLIRTSLH